MNLQQAIIELKCCLSKVIEVADSKVYKLAIKKGHQTLATDLEDVKHYLQNTLDNLQDLLDIQFVESLEIDLSKCVPFTKEMYERATTLTEGMEVNLDEDL
jgi:hypothetical protein